MHRSIYDHHQRERLLVVNAAGLIYDKRSLLIIILGLEFTCAKFLPINISQFLVWVHSLRFDSFARTSR